MGFGVGVLLAACGGESAWVPASSPPEGASGRRDVWVQGASEPRPAERSVVHPIELGSKRPMRPGLASGYELVSEGSGRYRFRWTGDFLVTHSGGRRFQGSVWTAGHFTSVVPGCDDGSCALEDEDYVSAVQHVGGGERIDWDTMAWWGWDGFSFTTDAEPLSFELDVEGHSRPDLLEFVASVRPSNSKITVGSIPVPTAEGAGRGPWIPGG